MIHNWIDETDNTLQSKMKTALDNMLMWQEELIRQIVRK